MSIQTRLEVQLAIQQWIANFMAQYNIDAATMEDALNKSIIVLKDQIMLDLLTEAAQQIQEEEEVDDQSNNTDREAE